MDLSTKLRSSYYYYPCERKKILVYFTGLHHADVQHVEASNKVLVGRLHFENYKIFDSYNDCGGECMHFYFYNKTFRLISRGENTFIKL